MPVGETTLIWNGTGSSAVGKTPFGYFDNDPVFIADCEKFAHWAAKKLGYPIQEVELIDENFYACFEEAVLEYGSQVNQFQIRNNLISVKGTKSDVNLSNVAVPGKIEGVLKIAKNYGSIAGAGGNKDWKRFYILTEPNKQLYNLNEIVKNDPDYEDGCDIEIRRVFHYRTPPIKRVVQSQVGFLSDQILGFGNSTYNSYATYMVMPLYETLLNTQLVSFLDTIYRSHFTFEIINNKIRLFPVPDREMKIYFDYTLEKGIHKSENPDPSKPFPGNNFANVRYDNIPYYTINDVGKQWIRKYALACAKETLGLIRGKYNSIPLPGESISLNGSELISQAQQEKEQLITQLRESLDESTVTKGLEQAASEQQNLQQALKGHPLLIYRG